MDEDVINFIKTLGVGCRHPKDEFFREGNEINKVNKIFGITEVDNEELCHTRCPEFSCNVPGCMLVFESLFEYDQHYNSSHRFSCSQCNKYLPSSHILDLHLLETHDAYFAALSQKKPMCYVQECKSVFQAPELRREHCIAEHKFPSDFRFDNIKKKKHGISHNLRSRGKKSYNVEMMECDSFKDTLEMECDNVGSSVEIKKMPKFKNFSFGHRRQKNFDMNCFVKDLKESLPDNGS